MRFFVSLLISLAFLAQTPGAIIVVRGPFVTSSGVQAWTTSYPTGLTACYLADTHSGVADGSSITSWTDTSATNIAATGVNVPTKETVSTKAVLRFNGTDDKLETSSQAASTWFSANNATIFLLLAQPANSAGAMLFWESTASTNTVNIYATYSDGTLYWRHDNDTEGLSVAKPSGYNTGFHTVICRRNGTTSASISVDGSNLTTGSMATSLNTAPSSVLILGYQFAGDVKAILIYNRVLTTDEETSVINKLNTL
jgi:hypothetical protein